MVTVWYATREDVKHALDSKETARNNAQIDRALDSASLAIEGDGIARRRFYPEIDTRTFDWPRYYRDSPRYRRLWLDENELVSVITLKVNGVTIDSGDYFVRRVDRRDEPPYDYIDIEQSAGAHIGATHERAVEITGPYGYDLNDAPAGAVAGALDNAQTNINVTNSAAIGVGSLIKVDAERMLVTGKAMLTTAQTIGGNLTAALSNTTVPVTTGSAYAVGEVILVDAERMLIVDIAGNNLIVKRQWDGSVLAAHSTGAAVFAARTLTVVRAALGTTAATHADTTPARVHVYPGPVRSLAIAEAVVQVSQESAAYARVVGSGDHTIEAVGRGLKDLRDQVRHAFARPMLLGVV